MHATTRPLQSILNESVRGTFDAALFFANYDLQLEGV